MKPTLKDSFSPVFAALIGAMRSVWTWPSPEVGFARYVFEQTGDAVPVPDDGGVWPVIDRLDHAPALAATGYLLSGHGRVLRPEWQSAWATGFERFSERDPFPTDRMTFAFRPLYVLGIALGAANCPLVSDTGHDWMRGVFRRLLQEGSTEPWSDLVYGLAARPWVRIGGTGSSCNSTVPPPRFLPFSGGWRQRTQPEGLVGSRI